MSDAGNEFGAIGSFAAEHPALIMYVDDTEVRLTGLSAEALHGWATYVQGDPSWALHSASQHPVSSLHRGAYSNVEVYPITAETLPRYEQMLAEMAARRPTITVRLPRFG